MTSLKIRLANERDGEAIRKVHLEAFSESEGQLVSTFAMDLMREHTHPETYSFVAEDDGVVIGQVAFSPLSIAAVEDWIGYILAPLGILPQWQGRGVGSRLVEHGISTLTAQGVHHLLVYGDPAYYGRFGFDADTATRFVPPFDLEFPSGWQAMTLNPGKTITSDSRIICVVPLRNPELW
jgi:putative acetyltransferase